ncbi:hypothetical protein SAMN03159476_00370 [Pseudomonas sp. NFPP05]|uniref:hypothetical protein n=1 Tax=unclassified Pseudomonas TaxID=196821 RepID=UPI0008811229|nr:MULTISPECIES: hypothetical protein [unclassified Pseudomonas]SDA11073.1 hypothetical protein SAMN03159465_00370 [Pseudomonas sp. NFPP12]SFM11940.1 hypothetical protein SAMN03159476_00370 [Pseudomonas sp. NFPP05]
MNTAMQICQARYDAMLPPEPVDTEEAERIWVDNAAYDLLDGQDVKFQRRMRSPQGVTQEQFAQAVDEYVMDNVSSPSVIGRLILSAVRRDTSDAQGAAIEAICAPDHKEALCEVARILLRPLAADGLIAQAEDDAL